MIGLDVWRRARADVLRVLRAARVWAWLSVLLALATVVASATWVSTAWQLPAAAAPVLGSEAVRRLLRQRRLRLATHDVRSAIGHDVVLLSEREAATLLTRGVVVRDGVQVVAITEDAGVRFETEALPHSDVPPLTTIFMRGGGAGGGGAAF